MWARLDTADRVAVALERGEEGATDAIVSRGLFSAKMMRVCSATPLCKSACVVVCDGDVSRKVYISLHFLER